jgi:universal stress protein A
MQRIRRLLYATDFSSASRRAYETALALTTSLNARLTIVYVLAPLVTSPNRYIDPATLDRLDTKARQWSARHLDRLAARAKKAGVTASVVLRNGEPADQIVRACRASKSDLIVLGTHARQGLPRFFLGSVAERVVSTAPCPVVTVRGT